MSVKQFNDKQLAAGQAPLPSDFAPPHYLDETNSYSYQNVQRQRQLTLGDLLLENRIVFLQGEIHTGNANEVVMKPSKNNALKTSFFMLYSLFIIN